jgi:RND superfamily putative drug exporter
MARPDGHETSPEVAPGSAVLQPRTAGSPEADGIRTPLHRWGLLVARRKGIVLIVWALLVLGGLVFLPRFNSSLSLGGFWPPGTESARASNLLAHELPQLSGSEAVFVFSSRTLNVDDPAFRSVVSDTTQRASMLHGVSGVELPYGVPARALIAPGGHTALALVGIPGGESPSERLTPSLVAITRAATTSSVEVNVTGEPQVAYDFVGLVKSDVIKVDEVGLPAALVVLLVVFGSVVAAGLPLLLALCSIALTFGFFGLFSFLTGSGLNTVMESVTAVLGLGIGIDYALFMVTRFREELRDAGPEVAVARTTATAGRTVLVSGSTVIAALAPVLLVNDPMIKEVMIGPMVAVAVLMAAALTLLPAALAGLGHRVDRSARLSGRRRRVGRRSGESPLASMLMFRPQAVMVCVVVVLGGLSVFTLQLHTGYDYGLSALTERPSGVANAKITAAFGPGEISPIEVVFVTGGRPFSTQDLQTVARFGARLSRDPHVRSVTSLPELLGGVKVAEQQLVVARTSPAMAASLSTIVNAQHGSNLTAMTVVPKGSFDTTEANQLVISLRRELPAALVGTDMHALVSGTSAGIVDFTKEINDKTPLVIGLVLLVAMLVLASAFRSVLVALVGLIGTMLSVGAAYGLLVLVFQKGSGQTLFDFRSPGFLQDWLPLLLFAVLVGLSTDYQVFLVSRVREEWEDSDNPVRAVFVGLRRSGRVILSAATIMIVVFASLIFAVELTLKELGFALSTVVFIDAVLTRRMFVPATLRLLGDRAWKGPGLREALFGRRPPPSSS